MFCVTMPLFFLGRALDWPDQTVGWVLAGAVGLVTSVWTYFRFSSEPPR
jgi:ABC-type glycerol-3-phosphate transport system permease component